MNTMEINYIGAIALLARLSPKLVLNSEDMECIEAAIGDFCRLLPDRFDYEGDPKRGFTLKFVRKPNASI